MFKGWRGNAAVRSAKVFGSVNQPYIKVTLSCKKKPVKLHANIILYY